MFSNRKVDRINNTLSQSAVENELRDCVFRNSNIDSVLAVVMMLDNYDWDWFVGVYNRQIDE